MPKFMYASVCAPFYILQLDWLTKFIHFHLTINECLNTMNTQSRSEEACALWGLQWPHKPNYQPFIWLSDVYNTFWIFSFTNTCSYCLILYLTAEWN